MITDINSGANKVSDNSYISKAAITVKLLLLSMEFCSNCCKAISVEVVNNWLTNGTRIDGKKLLLVDIRGHITYQKSCIKSAVNLRFSGLILRRIFRGTAEVDNVCPGNIKKDIEQRNIQTCA